MNNNIKNEEQIEAFITWLRQFYLQTPKKKNKIIKKVSKYDKKFSDWLESVRDFDIDAQFELVEQLRYSEW